ncbi:MAG: hypothetical protein N3B01_06955, partial [Verrucomicrobiae bacterium]|nr:hypothetical protein [Verrucomicrobiae bacterium]
PNYRQEIPPPRTAPSPAEKASPGGVEPFRSPGFAHNTSSDPRSGTAPWAPPFPPDRMGGRSGRR